MIKKESNVKYPHSASLFQFCRKVLDHKFGGIRVIDQDVGQILGFDPADCSHWKKGKKNIRSIQAIKSIAQHLGIDERLVVDVASGEMADWEAFCEYFGYGRFKVDSKLFDNAKKDFYLRNAGTWTQEKEQLFKSQFSLNEDAIDNIVKEIHKGINFYEAPLYLPEVVSQVPGLAIRPFEASTSETESATVRVVQDAGLYIIEYPKGDKMRPVFRFGIAKAMAPFFFSKSDHFSLDLVGEHAKQIQEIQCNLFAAKLLTPAPLIRSELSEIDIQKDLISQLSEIFWVSKSFMNSRLRAILQDSKHL